jgi:signal transduction histidine kinase
MFQRSLTAKILIAVGVTVALVIAIYTYFVIRVESAWWRERIESQNMISATVVHEYLEGVMLSSRHEEVQHFLKQLQASDEITHGRIINTNGLVIFSTETQEVKVARFKTPASLFTENVLLRSARVENGHRVTVTMSPIQSQAGCVKCHGPIAQTLGAIVMEKSLAPAEANIAKNRTLLIVYGVLIFVLVGIVLWLLIVRLVTQPVSTVLQQMRRVQAGDLSSRAAAESADEIGELAQGFNSMVESLETTTRELHQSHEKQIHQASKLASIGELASGIAHEIRNPLAGIGAAVEVLSDNGNGNGQHREIVGEIRQQINRLNTTLRELLDFARQREPEMAPAGVRALLKPMLGLVRIDAQKQHIEIIEDYPSDLPPIRADEQQVQQALLNVLLNAIQAMPDGGTLTVRVAVVAQTVRIIIADTGTGIARENLSKIFSPFYTTKHRGTGLGLAITRTIIEKHHGTISVESELNRGSTFILEFAACQPEVLSHGAN